jgi:Arc/MetJ-type ribon-helix-helix transcriptional regulator
MPHPHEKRKLFFWNIPVSKELNDRVEYAVAGGSYNSKSEFIRDACRRLLESLKEEKHRKS